MSKGSLVTLNPPPRKEPRGGQPLTWWANAYKFSEMLFALCRCGILDDLADRSAEAAQLAHNRGLDPGRVEGALRLLSQAGLLREQQGVFALNQGDSISLDLIHLENRLHLDVIRAGSLDAWLRGSPARDPLEGDPDAAVARLYLNGFETGAHNAAQHLWRYGRLRQCRSVLDLGGAAGAHAAAWCRFSDEVVVTVADRAWMEPPFTRRCSALIAASQARFVEVDLRQPESLGELAAGHDAVVLSNVLHLFDLDLQGRICRTLSRNMPAHGRLLVHDLFQYPEKDTPKQDVAAFMKVDWMLFGGEFEWDLPTFKAWLEGKGFAVSLARPVPGSPTSAIVAQVNRAS